MIKNRLDNYLITPPKNGCLTHVDPKLYTKCPHWAKIGLCLWLINLSHYQLEYLSNCQMFRFMFTHRLSSFDCDLISQFINLPIWSLVKMMVEMCLNFMSCDIILVWYLIPCVTIWFHHHPPCVIIWLNFGWSICQLIDLSQFDN